MSIKKYSSGSWVTVPYRKYETATDTITSLPKTIIGDGQNISAYTIKGNMTQSGTPTPSNPIYPQEVGDLVTTGEHAGEYEIPILSNGNTYPIYLSEPIRNKGNYVDECPSTGTASRVIKKLVLTGSEDWGYSGGVCFLRDIADYLKIAAITTLCSHYQSQINVPSINDVGNNCIALGSGDYYRIFIRDNNITSAADFKTFLTTQYNNGTPVTVWYVLATPTTESFTAPSIPTTGTAESFDVDTTLKPSEVSLTWHGWHEHSDTKYTSG